MTRPRGRPETSARQIVEWSDKDPCFVGSAPGLLYGGCHGQDEAQVFHELFEIVEKVVELYRRQQRAG